MKSISRVSSVLVATLFSAGVVAKNTDLSPSLTKERRAAAEFLAQKLENTVWSFDCGGGPVKIGFDSTGKVSLNSGYVNWEWRVAASRVVKFMAPDGEFVAFMFSPDASSFQFISFEGWKCSGKPVG